jgi:hypothetical protein
MYKRISRKGAKPQKKEVGGFAALREPFLPG